MTMESSKPQAFDVITVPIFRGPSRRKLCCYNQFTVNSFFFGKELARFKETCLLSSLARIFWNQRDNITDPSGYQTTT